jgi:hypothetical protein
MYGVTQCIVLQVVLATALRQASGAQVSSLYSSESCAPTFTRDQEKGII